MLDVGSVISSAVILGFMDQIDTRMGINKLTYLLHAMPIVDKLMIADAQINAANDPSTYLEKTFEELTVAFGGQVDPNISFDDEMTKLKSFSNIEEFIASSPIPKAIAAWALLGVVTDWDNIISAGAINPVDAFEEFMEGCQQDMENARSLYITDPTKIEFNAPPAIAHLICNGMYGADEFVTLKEVCTIIDISEAQLKTT